MQITGTANDKTVSPSVKIISTIGYIVNSVTRFHINHSQTTCAGKTFFIVTTFIQPHAEQCFVGVLQS